MSIRFTAFLFPLTLPTFCFVIVLSFWASDGMAGEPSRAMAANVYGRIQIVDAFPDYKVRVVKSFPDLKVQVVESFPNTPGKWRLVDSFPDFKIKLVTSGEDFTIQYVKAFPGPRR